MLPLLGVSNCSDDVFGLEPRADILQRMVRYQLAKRQAGTHKAKQRSEVNGPNKKIYKQKGTGHARHGNESLRNFVGGGRAFGPVPRSHAHDLPKKVRASSLKHALSAKAKSNAIIVLDKAELPSRKQQTCGANSTVFGLVNAAHHRRRLAPGQFRARRPQHSQMWMCCRFTVSMSTTFCAGDKLVLTRAAVEALEERFK